MSKETSFRVVFRLVEKVVRVIRRFSHLLVFTYLLNRTLPWFWSKFCKLSIVRWKNIKFFNDRKQIRCRKSV